MNKRYTLSVTEEVVQNPEFQWGRGGRIEVYDRDNKGNGYAIFEYRFFIPKELFDSFHSLFDGYMTDHPIRIAMNWNE